MSDEDKPCEERIWTSSQSQNRNEEWQREKNPIGKVERLRVSQESLLVLELGPVEACQTTAANAIEQKGRLMEEERGGGKNGGIKAKGGNAVHRHL